MSCGSPINRPASRRLVVREATLLLAVVLLGWTRGTPIVRAQDLLPSALTPNSPRAPAPTNLAGNPGVSDSSEAALQARLAQARASLALAVGAGGASLTNAPAGVSPQEISLRRALLQRLVHLYEQQLSYTAELETIKNRRAELVRQAQAWTGFAQPRPYSVLLGDGLREEIQAERLMISQTEEALSTLDRLIEENRDILTRAEESIRQINEHLEETKEPEAAAHLSWQREEEQLRSQVAAATMATFDLERKTRQQRLSESRSRLGLLQRKLVVADAGTQFTQSDLEKVVSELEAERRQLERELAEAETRARAARQGLESARAELNRLQTQPQAGSAATARAAEVVEVRLTQLETAQAGMNMLRIMLEARNVERTMWELRFAAYDSRSADTLLQSERRLLGFTERVALWKAYYARQLEVSSSQVALQETRLNELDPASDLVPLARERLASLRERDQWTLRMVRNIERLERLVRRWGESIKQASDRLPFTGRIRNLFGDARSFLAKLWDFELFTAEDTITVEGLQITGKRSVTIGKTVLALLILVVGYWITGLIARMLEPLFVKRFKIEPNQASLIRRWLRAAMVVCLVMFSLVSVKIPLTVFAFAGGALAIGLGFGTQTLLKNLVSGIIILFERPFRVGDVLDIAGQRGTVTSIGFRASVVQLWDGTETLIPNSSLLENNLTSWTYSTRKVRFTVCVGVAYGSDTRRVIQVLNEVVERHGLVEKEPKPQVLFTDFADSALTFEVRFWVDVLRANAAQVMSDLRLMIAGAFAEHGLVIAFPQRDVHLDVAQPIQIRLVPDSGPPPASPAEPKPEGGS